jgi:alpha-L-fucosidase 2
MVSGGVAQEHIYLHEDRIWAGPPIPQIKGNASETINQVRQLLFEAKYAEAQKLQQSALPNRISPRSYQPLGELILDFGHTETATGFQRDLKLDTAIATIRYQVKGVNYVREVFASPVDDLLAINIAADQPGALNFTMGVKRDGIFSVTAPGNDTLIATGQAAHGQKHLGVKFVSRYKVSAKNGTTQIRDEIVSVENADSAVIFVTVATDYNRKDTAHRLTHDLDAICQNTQSAGEQIRCPRWQSLQFEHGAFYGSTDYLGTFHQHA